MTDYIKICCNAIISFCTTYLASSVVAPGTEITIIAVSTAIVTAILSAAIEFKKGLDDKNGESITQATALINRILVI